MDGLTLLALAAGGAALGVVTGLVPGLHVNTLAAVGLAVWPTAGMAAVVVLVTVGTAHTFVSILPATYLGAPGEDTVLSVLPAHRLLHAGRGPEAVRMSVHASLVGLLLALPMAASVRWALPWLRPWLDPAVPWVVGGALVLLLAGEARRRRVPAALAVMALAAWLGIQASAWPVRAALQVPASPLLPLLSGLFGAPGLLASLGSAGGIPLQEEPGAWHDRTGLRAVDVVPGVVVSGATALMPGLTGAVATSLARAGRRDHDPSGVLATLSTVNTAHAVLALAMVWMLGRSRSGLAEAVTALQPTHPWTAGPVPASLGIVLQAVVVAGILGAGGTLVLDRPLRRALERCPGWAPPALGLACVVVLAAVLSGVGGLALLLAATVVGFLPLLLGTRRVHLVAALLVPILLRAT